MESRTLAPVLSYILSKMVERNDRISLDNTKRTVFHAQKCPLISLHRYLERVLSFAPCSNSCFIIALIYIDRIIQNNADFILNSLSVHRMLITSVMVATKFLDDETFNNQYYAKVGGLQVSELNALERLFLRLIRFDLPVPDELYDRYQMELVRHVQGGEELARQCHQTVPGGYEPAVRKTSAFKPIPSINPTLKMKSTPSFNDNNPTPSTKPTQTIRPVQPTPVVQGSSQCSQTTTPTTMINHSISNANSIGTCHENNETLLQYQSGFDYSARDMIPASDESSTTLDFGNLTVSGRPTTKFPQCTPAYPSNNPHHMVAVSWG